MRELRSEWLFISFRRTTHSRVGFCEKLAGVTKMGTSTSFVTRLTVKDYNLTRFAFHYPRCADTILDTNKIGGLFALSDFFSLLLILLCLKHFFFLHVISTFLLPISLLPVLSNLHYLLISFSCHSDFFPISTQQYP